MLIPKKTKFKKLQKIKTKSKNNVIRYLDIIKIEQIQVVAFQNTRLKDTQLNAAKLSFMKHLRRKNSKVVSTVFPDLNCTKKASEARMGKGKGFTNFWCCKIHKGVAVFSIFGESKFLYLIQAVCKKLPFLTKIVQS